jgi:hypothetical protein
MHCGDGPILTLRAVAATSKFLRKGNYENEK